MSTKIPIIFLLLTVTSISLIHGLELYKNKESDIELNLTLQAAGQYTYAITVKDHILQWDSGSISFDGDVGKFFSFDVSGDIADGMNESNPWAGFSNLYVQANIIKQLKIRLGQFKVPFGYEIFNGKDERPYLSHSFGSENISPGRDRGIMAKGTNIIGKLDYGIGFFMGDGTKVSPAESNGFLIPLQLTMGFKINKDFRIDFGGNGAFHKDNFNSGDFTVKDGLWFSLEYEPFKKQRLTFFTEFIEESLFNSNELITDGKSSLFSSLSYKLFFAEPAVTFELYDGSKRFYTQSDKIIITAGCTFHILKYGQLKLFYEQIELYKMGQREQALQCLVLVSF